MVIYDRLPLLSFCLVMLCCGLVFALIVFVLGLLVRYALFIEFDCFTCFTMVGI